YDGSGTQPPRHHAHAPIDSEAVYTCPMHPEVHQRGPGSCPLCGMALEPEVLTADDSPNPELAGMTKRLRFAAALSLPVFVLEMATHVAGHPAWLPPRMSSWVQGILATPVVVGAGSVFFRRGFDSIVNRSLNMFTLIALGTGVAWSYSVVALLFPHMFPAAMLEHDGAVPVYFEAAAVITTLVLLGQVLELRARDRTSGAIRALLRLSPPTAHRIRDDGSDEEVALADVVPGDRLRVRPG